MTPEDHLPASSARGNAGEEPPSTLIIYIAVLFAAWLLYLLARPDIPNLAPAWVRYTNNLPGFVVALLLAEGLYRRSRFVWGVGLLLAFASILIGYLNASSGVVWAGVLTGGQVIIGVVEIVLLLLPPTRRWVSGERSPPPSPAGGA